MLASFEQIKSLHIASLFYTFVHDTCMSGNKQGHFRLCSTAHTPKTPPLCLYEAQSTQSMRVSIADGKNSKQRGDI